MPEPLALDGVCSTQPSAGARFIVSRTGTASRPPSGSSARSGEQPCEVFDRQARACRVVDQRPVIGRKPFERAQTVQYRIGALGAAVDAPDACRIGASAPATSRPRAERDDDALDARLGEQAFERVFEHAAAGERQIPFRDRRAHASADAGQPERWRSSAPSVGPTAVGAGFGAGGRGTAGRGGFRIGLRSGRRHGCGRGQGPAPRVDRSAGLVSAEGGEPRLRRGCGRKVSSPRTMPKARCVARLDRGIVAA